jgi:hypothetical protein
MACSGGSWIGYRARLASDFWIGTNPDAPGIMRHKRRRRGPRSCAWSSRQELEPFVRLGARPLGGRRVPDAVFP